MKKIVILVLSLSVAGSLCAMGGTSRVDNPALTSMLHERYFAQKALLRAATDPSQCLALAEQFKGIANQAQKLGRTELYKSAAISGKLALRKAHDIENPRTIPGRRLFQDEQ